MWCKVAAAMLVLGLASCGTPDKANAPSGGTLGKTTLMTQDVKDATRQGIDACIEAVARQAPLTVLQGRGFSPSRGGYLVRIDNPFIFAGGSTVTAKLGPKSCVASFSPSTTKDFPTATEMTRDALNAKGLGQQIDVYFRRSADKMSISFRR